MAKQAVTYEQIMAELKRRVYKPVYMLMGDEPFYIDKIADYIEENVLNEDEKAFNQTIVYGKDTTLRDVISAAQRYPMMSPYQVIIVKEAQHIKDYDDLHYYLHQPLASTILVFCYKYGKLDGRKKSTQEIDKHGVLFESKKLYDNQIPNWIESYVRSLNIAIDTKASNMLAEFLGNDLTRIVSEIDKLLITKPQEENRISPELIERNIGISKDYNNFELISALTNREILKSNRIVDYFGKNPKNNPLVVTLTVLFNHFSSLLLYHTLKDKSQANVASELKINPFFVKDFQMAASKYSFSKAAEIIGYIRETDVKSKGFGNSSATDTDLLKELIFRILH